ncbi:uncharacterized protein LOC142328082 [Lycorma delicatula]|uniref:uncharacterized protein LOC142328082 n=1 Tax=Lycorma delicatula TaxID=130591 RepID=UPI003F517EA9
MKSKVPRPIQSLTTNKQKIPSGIRQTLTQANSTINKQKISLSKVVRKCDIKPQLVKRDEHKIQTSLLKPTSQILQETTSTLHLTSNNSIWHSSNNAETNKTVQNNLSSPRSFLPILAMKQQSSQARKIPLPRKSSSILSATSITQRQKTSKSVITTTSSKPRLEPILERGGQINRLK